MKTLLSTDTNGYENHIAKDSLAIPFIQAVVAIYNDMLLPSVDGSEPQPLADLLPGELVPLFKDPQSFIFDKMTGKEPVSLMGMQVNKHMAVAMLKKPTGYEQLIERIEYGNKSDDFRNGGNYPALTSTQIAARYDINEDGEVVITDEYRNKVQEMYKNYLLTDEAVKANKLAEDVIKLFEESGLAGKVNNPDGIGHFIKGLVTGNYNNAFEKNEKNILKFNNPEFRGNF